MLLIRPVELKDLDGLFRLTAKAQFGLTSLPRDRNYLEKRIRESVKSFKELLTPVKGKKPAGESYLFIMLDSSTGEVIGTSGIVSKVGGFEPFYSFEIKTSIHQSKSFKVKKEIKVLHLEKTHSGPAEIVSLFLHPAYRKNRNGRFLSLSRFLFMAEYPTLFDKNVLAELRGVITGQGRSAFWDSLGKHFFDIDFPKADYLSIINKKFIAELMPTHPIYIPLLPKRAQDVIGQVHANTVPAKKILENQGFKFNGHVDIFEGGPLLQCPVKKILTVRESFKAVITDIQENLQDNKEYLIARPAGDFTVCRGNAQVKSAKQKDITFKDPQRSVVISEKTSILLKVKIGDLLRIAPFDSPGK